MPYSIMRWATDWSAFPMVFIPLLGLLGVVSLSNAMARADWKRGIQANIFDWLVLGLALLASFGGLMVMGLSATLSSGLLALVFTALFMLAVTVRRAAGRGVSLTAGMLWSWRTDTGSKLGLAAVVCAVLGLGFLAAPALAAAMWSSCSAAIKGVHGHALRREQIVESLSALLGISSSVLRESRSLTVEPGRIMVAPLPASAVARLHAGTLSDAMISTAMPDWQIAEASSARLVLTPITAETLQARELRASTGGLVVDGFGGGPAITGAVIDLEG